MTSRHAVEFAALFLVLPVALAWARLRGGVDVPVIPTLVALAALIGLLQWRDPTFSFRDAMRPRIDRRVLRAILLRAAPGGIALVGVALWLSPDELLAFPRERTRLWALVMVFYPLLSVLPQEFLYRVFLFHRYRGLFPERALPAVSAAVFGLAHLLFGHWISVALTTVGGLLFATTYARTRCVWTASIEHAVYGQMVFTVGLGRYFYGGTIQAVGGD